MGPTGPSSSRLPALLGWWPLLPSSESGVVRPGLSQAAFLVLFPLLSRPSIPCDHTERTGPFLPQTQPTSSLASAACLPVGPQARGMWLSPGGHPHGLGKQPGFFPHRWQGGTGDAHTELCDCLGPTLCTGSESGAGWRAVQDAVWLPPARSPLTAPRTSSHHPSRLGAQQEGFY